MTSARLRILAGNQEVGLEERPLRWMPDDRLGALYQGQVFTVIAGPAIDLGMTAAKPSECRVVVDLGANILDQIAPGHGGSWQLEQRDDHALLHLRGSRTDLDLVERGLKVEGFHVELAGKGFRPTADGRTYDYFLRLPSAQPQRPSKLSLAAVLTPILAHLCGSDGSATHDEDLLAAHARIQALREERDEAHQREVAREGKQESENAALMARLGLIRAALETVREEASRRERSSADLSAEVRRLKGEIAQLGSAMSDRDSRLAKLDQDFGTLLSELERTEQRATLAEVATESLKAQLDALENRKADGTPEAVPSGGKAGNLAAKLAAALNVLLSRVELVGNSEDTLLWELSDWSQILGELSELNRSNVPPKGQRIEGADGWYERHFSTGQSNDGRIYYRWDKPGQRYHVLIAKKKTQKKDIDWLRGQ